MESSIWKSFIFLFLQFARVFGEGPGRSEIEKEILQKIFTTSKFHMYVRPYKNVNQTTVSEEPLDIFVSLYILNLDVDMKNQECTIQMYFRQEWNDSRLSYNDQGKISVLSIHDTVGLWTPDLFFVNEKFGQLHTLTKPNLFIKVYPQGRVLYSERVTVKFACPMDLRKYPFDTQICGIPIESYGYTASEVFLRWKEDTTFGTTEPSGFRVSYSAVEHMIHLAPSNYSRVELNIHLDRIAAPLLLHVFIPLGFLVVASWISFWIQPSDVIPRLTTATVTTFSAFMFLHSARDFLPPQCYLTGLDVWVGFSCFLAFAAFFENVYVVTNHKSTPSGNPEKKEVPELANGGKEKRKLMDILAGKAPAGDSKVDAIARMLFPSVFVLFTVIYLAYYLI